MATMEVTTQNFEEVVAGEKPVLVDFWATWCGPCRALGPIVEDVSEELEDLIDVGKCNVDDAADLAARFHIVSIPTLILFKGGEPVHTIVGSLPKAALIREIEGAL